MKMRIIPLTLAQANEAVARWHRHHKPARGHRFSIGIVDDVGILHGTAIIGRPVARNTPAYSVAEVTRLTTDGTEHACSMLYGAAARVAREMGFDRIQTFILDSEPGTSLRASGWVDEGIQRTARLSGNGWQHTAGERRQDQPTEAKRRWSKTFRP